MAVHRHHSAAMVAVDSDTKEDKPVIFGDCDSMKQVRASVRGLPEIAVVRGREQGHLRNRDNFSKI